MARLRSNLSKIAAAAPHAASAALLKTAADIVDLTKQLAPVDTGNLRDSYGALPLSANHVLVGTAVDYGKYQEFGTSQMAAQPHLTPAFHQSEETFKKNLADEIKKIAK